MFSETKVTEIYCMADDFCKEIAQFQENIWLKIKILNISCPTSFNITLFPTPFLP